ncbi:MAG: hypothetical protein AAGJ52_01790 [Pseudomonadota bacterium]
MSRLSGPNQAVRLVVASVLVTMLSTARAGFEPDTRLLSFHPNLPSLDRAVEIDVATGFYTCPWQLQSESILIDGNTIYSDFEVETRFFPCPPVGPVDLVYS